MRVVIAAMRESALMVPSCPLSRARVPRRLGSSGSALRAVRFENGFRPGLAGSRPG